MSKKIIFVVVSLAVAIPAFLSSQIIWPPHTGSPIPTTQEALFLTVLSVFEALSLGIGVSFIIFTWKTFNSTKLLPKGLDLLTYASIGWLMVSWWPHDNLHIHLGETLPELIYLEYAFHVTAMAAAVVVAFSAYKIFNRQF